MGTNICLFSDPWIPHKPGYRADREPATEPRLCDLITRDATWDEPMVRSLVTRRDTELIFGMPIPHEHEEDKYIWPYTKDGRLQARSVYHRLREIRANTETQGGRHGYNKELWRAIWGAQVIPKAKNYVWRLPTNAVAVKSNLV